MIKQKRIKPKAYFQITEDPPQRLSNSITYNNHNNSPFKLPIPKQYFFIDFTQDCSLRVMEKLKQKIQIQNPMELEQYGKYIVTNVEDCSKKQQQLVKFQEQKLQLLQKKNQIRLKVKQNLDKSKSKLRSLSSFCIKQNLLEQYSKPNNFHFLHDEDSNHRHSVLQMHDKRLREKQQRVLKRLGLYI